LFIFYLKASLFPTHSIEISLMARKFLPLLVASSRFDCVWFSRFGFQLPGIFLYLLFRDKNQIFFYTTQRYNKHSPRSGIKYSVEDKGLACWFVNSHPIRGWGKKKNNQLEKNNTGNKDDLSIVLTPCGNTR